MPDIFVEHGTVEAKSKTAKKDIFEDSSKPEEAEPEILDAQLKAALDVVRGINIYRKEDI